MRNWPYITSVSYCSELYCLPEEEEDHLDELHAGQDDLHYHLSVHRVPAHQVPTFAPGF